MVGNTANKRSTSQRPLSSTILFCGRIVKRGDLKDVQARRRFNEQVLMVCGCANVQSIPGCAAELERLRSSAVAPILSDLCARPVAEALAPCVRSGKAKRSPAAEGRFPRGDHEIVHSSHPDPSRRHWRVGPATEGDMPDRIWYVSLDSCGSRLEVEQRCQQQQRSPCGPCLGPRTTPKYRVTMTNR